MKSETYCLMQEILGRADESGSLLETDVYDILDLMGLNTPERILLGADYIQSYVELPVTFAGEHVYLKIQAAGLLHKTEAGGVKRVANNTDAILSSCKKMLVECCVQSDYLRGVLIVEEKSADKSISNLEYLLGARQTHDFGAVITFGQGGVAAEFWNGILDAEHGPVIGLAHNLDSERALKLLDKVAVNKLWRGYRGTEKLIEDNELANWLCKWAELIDYFDGSDSEHSPRIVEAEINPLVVSGGQVFPLDGLIRVERGNIRDDKSGISEFETDREIKITALSRLLHPATVAVAGVSSKRFNPGRVILNNLLAEDWPVERLAVIKPGAASDGSSERIDGVCCYDSVSDVPFASVDLYVLAVSAEDTLTMLEKAGGKVSCALLIAGGTSERAEGIDLGRQLGALLDRTGITAIGPNSLGLISRPEKVDTLFLPKFKLPRSQKEPACLAYISQSGAFMITRMNRMMEIEPRYAVSTGNQLRAGVADVLEAIARDDENVKVFAAYVEGFGSGEGKQFSELATRLNREGKRVILYKGGRTERGAGAASGHTASIAGDSKVSRQILAEAGVMLAESFEEFEDLTRLAVGWAERSTGKNRFAAVSNAGYECVGMADAVAEPLHAVDFSIDTIDRIKKAIAVHGIDQLVDVRNPIDLTPMAGTQTWLGAVEVLLAADNEIDVLIMSPVPPTPAFHSLPACAGHKEDLHKPEELAVRLCEMAGASDKAIAFVVDCGRMYDPFADALGMGGLPVFRSADRAIRAIRHYIGSYQQFFFNRDI